MHKIDGAGHVANTFVTEDEATNRPPTEFTADWFNAVQSEIVNVIESAGFTLSKPNNTQLRDAILTMIRGGDYKASVRVATTAAINLAAPGAIIDTVAMVVGDRFLDKDNGTPALRGIYNWNGAAVPATRAQDADEGAELNGGAIIPVEQGAVNADTNWQITTDGVVTIGITGLAFQSVGAQNFASNAEAQAFTVTNKTITPATLAAAFQSANQSLSPNGFQKLPGGFIMQWATGASSTAVDAQQTITFPISCPNNVLFLLVGTKATNAGGSSDGYFQEAASGLTLNNCVVVSQAQGGAGLVNGITPKLIIFGH